MPEKKRIKNRQLLISSLIIIAIISLTILIVHQYNKYYQIEKRLHTAYTSTNFQSNTLYKLFSTFSEADYLFRLYAINFKEEDFVSYSQKLDSVKIVIDSLVTLPISNNPIKQHGDIENDLAQEYLQLKKQVDHLVLYAKDTITPTLLSNNIIQNSNSINKIASPDHVIQNILNDSSLVNNTKQDTLVKKKKSLLKRIFQAKDDTLVNNNQHEISNTNQMDLVIRKNLDLYFSNNNKIYNENINQLRAAFSKLKNKEKQLLFANFTLLHNLKTGIEKLKQLDFYNFKKNQELEFHIYKENTQSIRFQLISALSLMVLMIILIISYQKQVHNFEKRLIKEKYYADQIAEEKTSILANISHEIRTPLNSLKGLINIIKKNNDNQIDEAIIQSVEHDITVVTSSINDILSLSKLESDSLQIKNEIINIYTLIEDLISLHTYQAQIKNLELINKNSLQKNITINSNPFRIKQIISNLITNAIKYTEKGKVTITSQISNSILIINVQDTGIGISPEQSDQVFRKYYVANNKSKVGGFGLGLYISQILCEQISGKLSFQSTLGKGTTFTFELPLSTIVETIQENTPKRTLDEIPLDTKIVFIDDSKINLFFAQQLFRGRENVDFFLDEYKAIDHTQANHVDIIITDLKMPHLTGWDILNIIKSNNSLQHIKVFVSTAEPLLLEANKGEYQFDAIINKPIQIDELVTKILNG